MKIKTNKSIEQIEKSMQTCNINELDKHLNELIDIKKRTIIEAERE